MFNDSMFLIAAFTVAVALGRYMHASYAAAAQELARHRQRQKHKEGQPGAAPQPREAAPLAGGTSALSPTASAVAE